jgi:N utilization substance protein B
MQKKGPNKHLPTKEDLNPNLKILSNRFYTSLGDNKEYLVALKKYKVEWSFDPELTKSLFITLKNSPEYAEYLAKTAIPYKQIKTLLNSSSKK